MISCDTPIVILHGLGNRAWTLTGLELYLTWHGYTDVYRPQYNADQTPEKAIVEVSGLLLRHFKGDHHRPIVVIGNSMGGVVAFALHACGWKIELAIAVNSPLNGSTLLRDLDAVLPKWLMDVCGGNSPTCMELKRRIWNGIPPHPYKTIGMALPFMNSDGLVYSKDATIEPEHHRALGWGSHHTVVADPRVYLEILRILQTQ